ncbi:BRCA1-associated ATM activator 1 [Syngnathoides biaculeatus]|uniref:BRCA1-associated ATM activator 1 n=1 Tax=Syngnathoides biaculeatus TaxID=300417 RepID=UPI002ADE2DAA|nr:BRCA1-associated ATM activator 1 [Syngnathoides biaculeatus]
MFLRVSETGCMMVHAQKKREAVHRMDKESASLLPGVCALLADSAKPPPDDTSLEKLLDRLTELSEAGVSLPESCPCLLDFISATASGSTSDPSILSFALKLGGLLSADEDGYRALQARSALEAMFSVERWKDSGPWDDPCVRIGWVHGLRRMLLHPEALAFFVRSDFIKPLLQLQSDPSMFVASAANQLLAHILLAAQPEEDERPGSETSAEHLALVQQASDHIKESLVPKEGAPLAGSLQVLKLLALILDRARRPLREQLLKAAAASLEELADAGCSQLTAVLMDVIMAAYSSTDSGDDLTGRLLSSMLNGSKADDLVRAAAAFLRRGGLRASRDAVRTSRAVRILLLPLRFVTEHPSLGAAPVADEHHGIMAAQLESKSSFISTVCVCLRNAPQVALMPSDVLPCPPAAIVLSIVALLKVCNGGTTSSSSSSSLRNGCRTETFRCIVNSGRVQKSALEALASLSGSPGANSTMNEVSDILVQYMSNPDSDPTVLQKSYKAFVQWMSVCTDLSAIPLQLREALRTVVEKRACDPRWEVRDSTVEFLGQLPRVTSLKSADEALLSERRTAPLLREALRDPESYVRASAVSALARGLGTELPQEQADTVSRLLDILREDTEGFARRAVVRYFMAWFSSCPLPPPPAPSLLTESVRTVLSRGSRDLDWEVKVNTLELAELLLDAAFSDHGRRNGTGRHPYATPDAQAAEPAFDSTMSSLLDQGVFAALLSSLADCDRPVALKACELLIATRDRIHVAGASTSGVSCELPRRGWGKEIRKLLKNEADDGERVGVREVLAALGLDDRRVLLSQSSDHVHNSFQSLLQDILSAGVTLGGPDEDDGQGVVVDCY